MIHEKLASQAKYRGLLAKGEAQNPYLQTDKVCSVLMYDIISFTTTYYRKDTMFFTEYVKVLKVVIAMKMCQSKV